MAENGAAENGAAENGAPAQVLAEWLLGQLVARGIREFVVCPGSRNAPLSFALAAAVDSGAQLRVHSRIDERTAAFLAVGIAKTSRRPVGVITTSGTATANLHPAILEASHAGVDVVAITADRPASLRGTGANQTTDQSDLFSGAARCVDLSQIDAAALAAAWCTGGPTHLNVQFADPLVPTPSDTPGLGEIDPGKGLLAAPPIESAEVEPRLLAAGPKTVVVAGDDAGPAARVLAESANWPLLAEPSSGSRTGSALRTYRLLLARLAPEVERAVVFGHPTLSRPVMALLSSPSVEVFSVPAKGRWPRRPFAVAEEAPAYSASPDDDSWLRRWQQADAEVAVKLDDYVDQIGFSGYQVARAVMASISPGGLLTVGASNSIRDLDIMGAPTGVAERRMVIANRGLAGIDGTVSTAMGAALGRPHSSSATALMGDVTFLHDLNALLIGPDEERPPLRIVVANDNGGSIFATLEQGAARHQGSFEKYFGTPHGAGVASLCAGLGVPHRSVNSEAQLGDALAEPQLGIDVIEARIDRAERRTWDQHIKGLALS